jgi:hypothetical protein
MGGQVSWVEDRYLAHPMKPGPYLTDIVSPRVLGLRYMNLINGEFMLIVIVEMPHVPEIG